MKINNTTVMRFGRDINRLIQYKEKINAVL